VAAGAGRRRCNDVVDEHVDLFDLDHQVSGVRTDLVEGIGDERQVPHYDPVAVCPLGALRRSSSDASSAPRPERREPHRFDTCARSWGESFHTSVTTCTPRVLNTDRSHHCPHTVDKSHGQMGALRERRNSRRPSTPHRWFIVLPSVMGTPNL
jgi:hypothetical protein